MIRCNLLLQITYPVSSDIAISKISFTTTAYDNENEDAVIISSYTHYNMHT